MDDLIYSDLRIRRYHDRGGKQVGGIMIRIYVSIRARDEKTNNEVIL